MLAMHIFSVALSYAMKPYRPRLTLVKVRSIFSFSVWLVLSNVLIFLETRFADFIVGARLGAKPLGVLNMTIELGATPATQLVAAANRAIYPGYAKLADDRERFRETYLSTVCAIAMVAVPIGLGIAAVADPMVRVLLGEKWLDVIPLLAILGVYGLVGALISNTTYIFYALAKPEHVTYFSLIHVAVLIPLIFLFVAQMGLVGVAWAMLATNLFSLPVVTIMANYHLRFSLLKFVGSIWRSLLAGAIMFFSVQQILGLGLGIAAALELMLAVAVGALSYAGALGLLVLLSGFRQASEWSIAKETYQMIAQKLGRTVPSP